MRTFLATAATLLALGACSSDSTGISEDELVGTWTATEFTVTSAAMSADLIEEGGTFTAVFNADGSGQQTTNYEGDNDSFSVQWDLDGDELVIDGDERYEYDLNGDTLSLTGTGTFDLDDDGTEEDVTFDIVLERAS